MINIDAKSYEGKKFRHEDIELIRFSVQNVFEEMRSGCWKLIVSNLANPNQLYAMFGRGKVSELRREIERMFLRIQKCLSADNIKLHMASLLIKVRTDQPYKVLQSISSAECRRMEFLIK